MYVNESRMNWRDVLPITITSLLFISQIIVGLFILDSIVQNEIMAYVGITLYISSGWLLGMLPIIEFRKNGEVKKGKSYINTTKLVDTGIYSIIRHPQFTTWMIWSIAGMLLFQHWIVILIGIPIIPLTYIDLLRADERLIHKFKDQYKQYMQNVPRANIILGLYRYVKRKKRKVSN